LNINVHEVVKQLEGMRKNVEGQSTKEIAKEMGRNIDLVREFMRNAVAAGMCEYVGCRRSTTIDGKPYKIPLYRFKLKKTKKK